MCWIAAEKTFDCPVHGSRFSNEGLYVTGLAKMNLTLMNGPDDCHSHVSYHVGWLSEFRERERESLYWVEPIKLFIMASSEKH